MFTPQTGKQSEAGPSELLRFQFAFESTYTRTLCSFFRALSDTDTRTHYTAAAQLILGGQFCVGNLAGLHAQAQTRWILLHLSLRVLVANFVELPIQGPNSSAFELTFEPHELNFPILQTQNLRPNFEGSNAAQFQLRKPANFVEMQSKY